MLQDFNYNLPKNTCHWKLFCQRDCITACYVTIINYFLLEIDVRSTIILITISLNFR